MRCLPSISCVAWGVSGGLLLLIAACTSSDPRARALSLAEFSSEEAVLNVVVDDGMEEGLPGGISTGVVGDGTRAASDPAGGAPGGGAAGGSPVLGAGDPRVMDPSEDQPEIEGERAVLVESLVGQVNGRAIYADDFFEPIEDQLIATAEQAPSDRRFRDMAAPIIMQHLQQRVLDELYLAEAESSLSVEERQGLIHWMRQLQEEVIAQRGGNRSAAEKALADELGREIDVEGYVGEERDRQLVIRLLHEKIWSRVIVSWRDVEREYNRRYAEFNPPAHARLKRIRLSKRRHADLIEQTETRLEAGEDFSVVADAAGMANGGEWQEFELGPEGLAGVELSDPFIEAIGALEVGETSAGFAVGSSVWWVHYASLEAPEALSLYDPVLQRRLRGQIRGRRVAEEESRFVTSLLEEGIDDQLQGMAQRLELIAMARYAPGR